MKPSFFAPLLLGVGLMASCVQGATAEVANVSVSQAQQHWWPQLQSLIGQLPQMQVQASAFKQQQLASSAASQAIYNPELDVSYQNASEDTYGIGLSQTLDWGDKQGSSAALAQLALQQAELEWQMTQDQLLASALQALVAQDIANKEYRFAKQQVEHAGKQLNIGRQRVAAGDLPQVALQQLALELANNSAEFALAEQAQLAANSAVMGLLGQAFTLTDFMQVISMESSQGVDARLPALQAAYLAVRQSRLLQAVVASDTSVDPNISVSAEREGSENKFGIGLSIPLQVRNRYQAEYAQAGEAVIMAEQQYLVTERQLQQDYQLFQASIPNLLARYQDWRELVYRAGSEIASTLAQQWRSGDLATGDYLQSQRQLASSYQVGLQLEQAIYNQWINWMASSGQLTLWFEQIYGQAAITSSSSSVNQVAH
ncbi:TolC family protein [Shewanella sp. NIFS-20-20]|uniref:TolC family protein n=1 Tax=Shewanella sp. NIFS-20-20 TaxID=2853806 RepID=UPI001C474061|nr:TolC family protein [Shewanella sp. NIFS-20-20]MBV7315293.1 TolC family protein [Shewanella sp. NIFS-20-20]